MDATDGRGTWNDVNLMAVSSFFALGTPRGMAVRCGTKRKVVHCEFTGDLSVLRCVTLSQHRHTFPCTVSRRTG